MGARWTAGPPANCSLYLYKANRAPYARPLNGLLLAPTADDGDAPALLRLNVFDEVSHWRPPRGVVRQGGGRGMARSYDLPVMLRGFLLLR